MRSVESKPTRYGFLLLPNYSMIAVSSAVEVLRMANQLGRQEFYQWPTFTMDGNAVQASNGLEISPGASLEDAGALDFTFPIGDDFRLRPMRIEDGASVNTARGAYFFNDPQFNTQNIEPTLFGVSIFEFWDLDSDIETRVTLTWDDNSNIPTLVEGIEDLRVVGWSPNTEQWVNLGNSGTNGDLSNGEITSEPFIPNDYTVLTFGSSELLLDGDFEIFNGVSPNNDGDNDFFMIQGLGNYPNNEVFIYNRWGVLVYQRKAYHEAQANDGADAFNGISQGRATIAKGEELPVGTYYYILKVEGLKDRAGYLYINR